MTQVVEEKRALPASKKVVNINKMTIISNSQAEFCIYSYKAEIETHFDIKDPIFFNPAVTVLRVGDIIRVFKYDKKDLTNYYEFIVTVVDKLHKEVKVVSLVEKNLVKKTGDK